MSDEQLIERVKLAIENAETGVSRVSKAAMSVGGFTSDKIRHLLNNLCRISNNYLEIGIFRGSTYVSANCNNKLHHSYAIDNWSQDFGEANNKEVFFRNMESINWGEMDTEFKIIDQDCFEVDEKQITDVDCFFMDGNHSYESQRDVIIKFKDSMADVHIYVVDDCNWADVERGTRDGIKEAGYKILYENHLGKGLEGSVEQYWNGIGVFILKK